MKKFGIRSYNIYYVYKLKGKTVNQHKLPQKMHECGGLLGDAEIGKQPRNNDKRQNYGLGHRTRKGYF